MTDPLQLVGTTLGDKYAVESMVGEGGFAVVYRAQHLIWKRPVAIKVFKAVDSFAPKERERLLDAFVREGQLLAELSERSSAICQARDIGTLTTPSGVWAPYMVLEWLDGVSLDHVVMEERSRGLAPRTALQALGILEPVAEALSLAHGRGIAHRDVKPDNILIVGDPRSDNYTVKLLDFGIAKVVQDVQKIAGGFAQTSGHITSFTPAYGAPEQFSRGHGPTGPWTDVYALALIFCELASGREPLQGDDLNQLGFATMDRTRRPTPRVLGALVSDEVEAVFARALAVSTRDRHSTAGEFWNALRDAMGMPPIGSATAYGAPSSSTRAAFGSSPDAGVPSSRRLMATPPVPADEDNALRTATTLAGPSRTRRIGALLTLGGAALLGVGALGFLGARRGAGAAADGSAMPAATAATAASGPPGPLGPIAPLAKAACPAGMVLVPGGKFFMGSDDKADLDFERPAHQVTLAPFCVNKYEVTVSRYKACSDRGECKRASSTNDWESITDAEKAAFDPVCNMRDPDGRANHPINCVDWEMADAFCRATPRGRLPTEAEWEFAARGQDGRKFPWGDEPPDEKRLNACDKGCVAWGKKNGVEETAMFKTDDGYATTAPVGSFPAGASRYGVEDVVGNVWEWTADWYAPYTEAPASDPKGPSEETRAQGKVIRGGAWNGAYPAWVRPTFRYHDSPAKKSYGIGFRCAAEPG